ncbi:DUF4244 domain-containing protein [Polycladomyces sp. WAk]|uniref:DUF4244 domain-containing protein n=1 Tax=Polycladomyces zharkentensis TaxID=2807616 RepID=A0ABS2WMJ9_9BACL|nr:DUF4244 domain-containing protein [Polycladomyces sp. WAk]MBN2910619.1 DUF4244 domain-containing protein [Polycladomyces sp. WAk]
MNKWMAKGFHAVEDVKEAFKKVLIDRKGGSTVEYVVVLAAAVALAGVLYNYVKNGGGQSLLQQKIQNVFNQIKS